MVRLLTLGGLALGSGGGNPSPTPLAHHKRNALLAYLAVEAATGAHSRDTLYHVFWPDSDDPHARDALKQLLRSLRRQFGSDLLAVGRGNGVKLGRSVSCDAAELSEAHARGDHAKVLALYRGDFLAGFHLSGSLDFEHWVTGTRSRLREEAVRSGKQLAERQDRAGDLEAATRTIEQVLRLQPFDEASVRTLLKLHIATGERSRSLETYARYAQSVAEAFDTTPAPETVALAESARTRVILNKRPNTVTIDPSEPPRSRPPGTESTRSWNRALMLTLAASAAAVISIPMLSRPSVSPAPVRERVLVDLFENLTGDPGLDYLAALAADHVTAGLTLSAFADVVTRGTPLLSRRRQSTAYEGSVTEAAIALGAGTIVAGSYTLIGDSVRFDAILVSADGNNVVGAVPPATSTLALVSVGLEALQNRVLAAVGAHVDPRLAGWARHATKPPTFESYLLFVEGLETHTTRMEFSRAADLFLEAYQTDTTFAMAALWAAQAAGNAGDRELADSLLQALRLRRHSLPEIDRLVLESFSASSPERTLDAWRQVVTIAPGSDYLKNAAYHALRQRRPVEALTFLRAADPQSGWLWGWRPFWSDYSYALDAVDECEAIPALAEHAKRSLPLDRGLNERTGAIVSLRGLSCLGDVRSLLEVGREYVASRDRFGWSPAGPELARAAAELIAHGYAEPDAEPFVQFVADDLTARIEENPRVASQLGELLASFGQADSAQAVLERAYTTGPEEPWWETPLLLAVLDIQAGRSERVDELINDARSLAGEAPWVELQIAAVRAHQGDFARAIAEVKATHPGGPSSWYRLHNRPFLYGPLLAHPTFQQLVAPLG